MERSDVIARAGQQLHGLADASDERSDVVSTAGQLKAHELVLQLCRQLKGTQMHGTVERSVQQPAA